MRASPTAMRETAQIYLRVDTEFHGRVSGRSRVACIPQATIAISPESICRYPSSTRLKVDGEQPLLLHVTIP